MVVLSRRSVGGVGLSILYPIVVTLCCGTVHWWVEYPIVIQQWLYFEVQMCCVAAFKPHHWWVDYPIVNRLFMFRLVVKSPWMAFLLFTVPLFLGGVRRLSTNKKKGSKFSAVPTSLAVVLLCCCCNAWYLLFIFVFLLLYRRYSLRYLLYRFFF